MEEFCFSAKNKEKLRLFIEKLKHYDYVSFDIFDTLMFRAVPNAYDQLKLVSLLAEEKENVSCKSFPKQRIKAENLAREQAQGREVTLDDIYKRIDSIEIDQKNALKNLECKVEIQCCYPNNLMIEVLKWCVANGKHVVIISDMYLTRTTIEAILCKIGAVYEHLFISSEEGLTKRSGLLFDVVLSKLGLKASQLIHIGDDLNNDIEQPRKRGIHSVLRLVNECSFLHYHIDKNNFKSQCLDTLIKGYLSNANDNLSSKRIGYGVLGPFLVDFCQWLHEMKEKQNIDKLAFVAREGYLIYNCYSFLYPQDDITYVSLNKNVLRLPTLSLSSDIDYFLMSLPERKSLYWKDIFKYLFVPNEKEMYSLLKKHFPNFDSKLSLSRTSLLNGKYNIELMFVINIQRDRINEQKILLDKYLEEKGFLNKKIGLVNNSINGSGQYLLQKYVKSIGHRDRIVGLQFTSSKKCQERLGNRFKAFFSQAIFPRMYRYYAINYCFLLEHLMFESVGTAFYLRKCGNTISVLNDKRHYEQLNDEFIQATQYEALQFCEDYKERLQFRLNGIGASLFFSMCVEPFKEDALALGNLWDDDIEDDKQIIDKNMAFSYKYLLGKQIPNSILWSNGFLVANGCTKKELSIYMFSSRLAGHLGALKRRINKYFCRK